MSEHKIEAWQKPPVAKPVVNELQRDISQNALSQLVTYLGQMSPQVTGRSIDGAAPVDIYQDGVYAGTVSAINFEDGTATAQGSAPSTGGGGTPATGGVAQVGSPLAAYIRAGSGSPAGVIAAPVGTLYLDLAGGAASTLYVKEAGTGTSGWVAK